jgi:3-methylfumaryl-CoA hydratase
MSTSVIDEAALQAWVGRRAAAEDALHPFAAQAMAAALDRGDLPAAGDVLPPSWQWLYFLDTPRASATGTDGHAHSGAVLPPAPLPRRMWAAGTMHIEQPLRLGVPAQRRSVIRSIEVKKGRSGTLVFLNLDHELSQEGSLCIREEQNLVYREMATGPAPESPGEPAPAGQWSREITPDPVLLFRYSALTYNGHRIHYDRPYAREREFYPDLVVHGPLLASLLLELCQAQLPGAAIKTFRFRALRPTFDSAPFSVNGNRNGNEVSLWSAQRDQLCMSATVTLA